MPDILLKLNVNEITQDVVISHFMTAQRDAMGKIIYVNEPECIVKTKGKAHTICVYVRNENDKTKCGIINLDADGIKELYKAIIEIEKVESEEFWD